VWWADLADPRGSEPGHRRPLLVIQADSFNRSRIRTIIAVVLTSNLLLVDAPGNVLIPARASGLRKDSIANVSQIVTLDRAYLVELVGTMDSKTLRQVESGLRLVLGL